MASQCSSKAQGMEAAAGEEMLLIADELGLYSSLSKAAGVGEEEAMKGRSTGSKPEFALSERRTTKRKAEEMVAGCLDGEKPDAVAAASGDECLTSRDSTPEEEEDEDDKELDILYEGWMQRIRAIDTTGWSTVCYRSLRNREEKEESQDDEGEEVVQEPITN